MNINQITIDSKLNPRHEGLDLVIVAEYAEAMQKGDIFPPIEVFSDNNSYWVVDGFHRLEAAKQVGLTEIAANIHVGSWRDAKLFSFGVNAEHGKRRTNADKRKAVTEMLGVSEWASWSDREIARRCKVHHDLVGKIRIEIHTGDSASIKRTFIHPKTGQPTTMNTANIGKTSEGEPIEANRQNFQYKRFADMLGIRKAAFNLKVRGMRRFKLNQLMKVAAHLGEDPLKYLRSHSDAADLGGEISGNIPFRGLDRVHPVR